MKTKTRKKKTARTANRTSPRAPRVSRNGKHRGRPKRSTRHESPVSVGDINTSALTAQTVGDPFIL